MPCRYCERDRACPFTVTARVGDTDATVEFAFCSPGCLAAWADPTMEYDAYDVSGDPIPDEEPTAPRTGADRPGRSA